MTVHHSKVSGLASDGDATKVQGPDWDAAHVVDNASITNAMLATMTATTVKANATGGAASPTDITPSALLDLSSNVNGAILTRTGGTWAVLANVASDNGDLLIGANAAPVAPTGAQAKVFATNYGGKSMLASMSILGDISPLGTIEGRRSIAQWIPAPVIATFTVVGLSSATAVGTATARTFASTSLVTGSKRLGYVSTAVAGNVGGVRANQFQYWRGNTAKAGGFLLIFRFAVSDAVIVTNGRTFVGLNSGGAPTDVDPSTLTNQIGVGCDGTDTNLQLYAAGAAAQARVSLGANFPVNGTTNADAYELVLYAAPNDSKITYQLLRLNTGDLASGTVSAGANLMANTQGLLPQFWRSNNTTAAAVGIDVMSFYGEAEI